MWVTYLQAQLSASLTLHEIDFPHGHFTLVLIELYAPFHHFMMFAVCLDLCLRKHLLLKQKKKCTGGNQPLYARAPV